MDYSSIPAVVLIPYASSGSSLDQATTVRALTKRAGRAGLESPVALGDYLHRIYVPSSHNLESQVLSGFVIGILKFSALSQTPQPKLLEAGVTIFSM
jgi:hypothetical protein